MKIATEAHKGQVDKSGREYIQHPITVASFCEREDEKVVALLHDIIEDTDVTADDLRQDGFDEGIVVAVELLTKNKVVDYDTYIKNVKANSLARAVKIADLTHNSDTSRLNGVELSEKDYQRLKKYKKSLAFLRD